MVGGTEARHGRRGRTHRRAGRLAIMIVGRSLSISQRDFARVPANLTITDLMTGEGPCKGSTQQFSGALIRVPGGISPSCEPPGERGGWGGGGGCA